MSLPDLPIKVLSAICSHLCPEMQHKITAAHLRDIYSLSLTSKRLQRIANPFLYRNITIGPSSQSLVSLLRTVYQQPDVGQLVRGAEVARLTVDHAFISIYDYDPELVNNVLEYCGITLPAWMHLVAGRADYVYPILALLPKLENLHYP